MHQTHPPAPFDAGSDRRALYQHRDFWHRPHRIQDASVSGALASIQAVLATPIELPTRSGSGPQLCYRDWRLSVRWLIKGYVADLKDPQGRIVGEPLLCFSSPELALIHAQKYVDWLIARR